MKEKTEMKHIKKEEKKEAYYIFFKNEHIKERITYENGSIHSIVWDSCLFEEYITYNFYEHRFDISCGFVSEDDIILCLKVIDTLNKIDMDKEMKEEMPWFRSFMLESAK